MGILFLLLLVVSICIVHYIYLLYKIYTTRHYSVFQITYYIEYFDEVSSTYCWRFETRIYRFHSKRGTWEEPTMELNNNWKIVSDYRAKRLNNELNKKNETLALL
jgi:hypothetical protein